MVLGSEVLGFCEDKQVLKDTKIKIFHFNYLFSHKRDAKGQAHAKFHKTPHI